MLRKHITWRKVHQIDTILEDFKPSEIFLNHPYPSVVGFDKNGDMLRYSPSGLVCPIDLVKCFPNFNNFMKHWFWFAEKTCSLIKEENKKTGKKGYQCTVIFDCDQLSFATVTSRVTVDMLIQFISAYQDNYPERMKAAFAINAPPYVALIFSIVKTMMSSAMLRKIHIIGRDGWKEKLLEMVDPDVLPKFLGGNRTDPDGDPRCTSFINQGGKIPAYYFLTDKERYFKDMTKVKIVSVPANEKKEIRVDVDEIGSLLKWDLFVKGKDIGFGIFLEASEHKNTEIIPIHRYDTSSGVERDSLKCRLTGKYIIVFDNSYSWMSSKAVQYIITVVKPTS